MEKVKIRCGVKPCYYVNFASDYAGNWRQIMVKVSLEAAQIALATLQPMIELTIDFNALTFDLQDEELVNWLVQDPFCKAFEQSQVYLHPARIIKKSDHCTTYLYQEFQIEHTFLPPTDWEFVTTSTSARKEIIDRTWWGYEDGFIDVGFYIEKILNFKLRGCRAS
jgi:hypothetical protein